MGASLWRCSEAARRCFADADRVTGLRLSRVCFEGPSEQLTDTAHAQPAVVATSIAAALSLVDRLAAAGLRIEPRCCSGHSVGELAALAVAGALSVPDALSLVAHRGRLMAEASALADGSMCAVMGLDEGRLLDLCSRASAETDAAVQVANLNAPGQIVLSGNRRALVRAGELAKAAGARRVIPLDVSGPFHSVYMQSAADGFRGHVAEAPVSRPRVPVVLNVTARPCDDPAALSHELGVQVTSPVRWADSVEAMVQMGCTVFVELGPGQVLSGLIKRIARDATVLNVEDEESLISTSQKLQQLLG